MGAFLVAVSLCAPPAALHADEQGLPVAAPDGDGEEPPALDDGAFNVARANMAIARGIVWLRKRQGRSGSWGPTKANASYGGDDGGEGNHAGPTALSLYALLKCQVPVKHPAIKKGFAYIEKHYKKPHSSYEVSALLLAVCATADNTKMSKTARKRPRPKLSGKFRGWANKLVEYLCTKRTARGWRYNHDGQVESEAQGGPEDLSSTQLAALALFAAHRLGIKAKKKVWEDILSYSLDQQAEDGTRIVFKDPLDPKLDRTARARGFSYHKDLGRPHEAKPSGGMTCCGIANIEMARFVLSEGGKKREQWDRRKDAKKVQEAIFDGLAWLHRNWSPFENPSRHSERMNHHVCWIFTLGCAMDLLGLACVGEHAWFTEVGQELLNRQASDGYWNTRSSLKPHDVLDTAFALLFVSRNARGLTPYPHVTGGRREPFITAK